MLHPHRMLAASLCAFALCGVSQAETIAVGNSITITQSQVPSPTRGMTMKQVEAKFGAPASKTEPVGKPPITRWDYPAFQVYFEYDHVIHSVSLAG